MLSTEDSRSLFALSGSVQICIALLFFSLARTPTEQGLPMPIALLVTFSYLEVEVERIF
jgi:hypothetical protein